jgi:hypothetical protein
LQRWLNRDPIGESGGINLYRFVGNNSIGIIDYWGLAGSVTHGTQGCKPGDGCADLADKIAAWIANLNERIDELNEDKNNLKNTDPKGYNNHIQQAYNSARNLLKCYSLFQGHKPPCCQTPSSWKTRPIPRYVDETTITDRVLTNIPGSDRVWIGVAGGAGAVGVGAAIIATGGIVGVLIEGEGGVLVLAGV